MKKFFVTMLMFLISLNIAEAGHLEEIAERGSIRIGTTGDYRPMSYYNVETGSYEGIDAELSQLIADSLNVKIEYVPTTWSTANSISRFAEFREHMRALNRWRCLTVMESECLARRSSVENPMRKNSNRSLISINRAFAS